jgi:hypothetical protein
MSQSDFNQENPYRAPEHFETSNVYEGDVYQRKMLKDFRSQILALGVFWIIIGTLVTALGIFAGGTTFDSYEEGDFETLVRVVFIVIGASWTVLGVLSCLKQVWAVYVGLVLSYISLLGNLINVNLCGLIILIVVIVQAHRVIGWAGKLRRVGIALTARPDQIELP